MSIYIGPWKKDDEGAWSGPDGTVQAFDLRTMDQQDEEGTGLFWIPSQTERIRGVKKLADTVDDTADGKMRSSLAIKGNTPKGKTLMECLQSHVMTGSDRDGIDGLKPIMLDSRRNRLSLSFGGETRRLRVKKNGKHLKRIFRMIEKDVSEVSKQDLRRARKALGYELRKLGLKRDNDDWKEIIKDKAVQKSLGKPEKPETSISDDFNRADEDPIASPWSTIWAANDWELSGNQVNKKVSEWGGIVNTNALSGSDQIVTNDTITTSNIGPMARAASTSVATFYFAYIGGLQRLYKVVTGSRTSLGQSVLGTTATWKLTVDGSTQELERNGSSAISVTDTAISSGLYTGMAGFSANLSADNWSASDIGGGGGGLMYTHYETSSRGVERGCFVRTR